MSDPTSDRRVSDTAERDHVQERLHRAHDRIWIGTASLPIPDSHGLGVRLDPDEVARWAALLIELSAHVSAHEMVSIKN
jgi:hypothetical protein